MEKNYIFRGGITKYWWIPIITGILSIAIGVWCLCCPVESLPILAYAFAIVLCAAGAFNLIFALANSKLFPGWGWSLAMGVLELICGIWMLCLPQTVLTGVFMYIIGIYIIFAVINAICDSCTFYGMADDWFGWILAILLITLVFAAVFMAGPIVNGIAVWVFIGISFIMFGIYRLIVAAKIRRLNKKIRF